VYPDEKEVLFRAGSQFQVLHRARPGLKSLLQAVMRCDLSTVDVCEMRELTLGCWRDLQRFLPPTDLDRNIELLEFIDTIPTRRMVVRNVMKDVSQPMTTLAFRPSDGASVLHMAVRVPNNLPCVQLVSARLAEDSFRHRDSEGLTALEVAIACGHADVAVYLMHRSSTWNDLLPSQLDPAASWVAKYGDDPLAKQFFERLCGAKGVQPESLQTALHAACCQGRAWLIELLLDCKADPHGMDAAEERTPLMLCAERGHTDAMAALAQRNVSVGLQNADGWSALMLAAANGHPHAVAGLLDARADPNEAMLSRPSPPSAVPTVLETIQRLESRSRKESHTRLERESSLEHQLLDDLLELRGAAFMRLQEPLRHGMGTTPLMVAVQSGNPEVIQLLLDARASVHMMREDGATSLIIASLYGQLGAAQLLVKAGANVNLITRFWGTPLQAAAVHGHTTLVRYLVQERADIKLPVYGMSNPLRAAAIGGHVACIKALLEAGADPSGVEENQTTPLLAAAFIGRPLSAQVLLQAKADPNFNGLGGLTALMAAAAHPDHSTLHVLLEGRADPNLYRGDGLTALMVAVAAGNISSVRALLDAQAQVNPTANAERSPLMVAVAEGRADIVCLLLDARADAAIDNNEGNSPMVFATSNGPSDIAQLLPQATTSTSSSSSSFSPVSNMFVVPHATSIT